ncbi:MAG: hypothetical protein Kow00122_05160 [Thermoleophilia bacterium]
MSSSVTDLPVAESRAAAPRAGRRAPAALLTVGALLAGAALVLIPPDRILGASIRAVFFHGAVTWTGIILAGVGGVAGTVVLARGAASPAGLAGRLWRIQSLAASFWTLSLMLSFPVMRMTWGGVLWSEPRLLMSAEVVATFLILWTVGLLAGDPRWTAAAMLLAVAVMGVLLAATPGSFHPDNPVLKSGSVRYIGTFLAIVTGLLLVSAGTVLAGRRRP